MPGATEPTGADSIVTLDSLPVGSLSRSQIKTLREAEAIQLVGPLVIDTVTDRVTHFDLVHDDMHYFLGWNPTATQWEQILVVADKDGEITVESAVSPSSNTRRVTPIDLTPGERVEIPEIVEALWEYVANTYPETDALYNVMEDTLKDMPADDL